MLMGKGAGLALMLLAGCAGVDEGQTAYDSLVVMYGPDLAATMLPRALEQPQWEQDLRRAMRVEAQRVAGSVARSGLEELDHLGPHGVGPAGTIHAIGMNADEAGRTYVVAAACKLPCTGVRLTMSAEKNLTLPEAERRPLPAPGGAAVLNEAEGAWVAAGLYTAAAADVGEVIWAEIEALCPAEVRECFSSVAYYGLVPKG